MAIPKDELKTAVGEVLESAATGKTDRPQFLTAYQILQHLPEPLRTSLIAQYAKPGRGAGEPFSAASRIGQIATELGAEHEYLDVVGLAFPNDETSVAAGARVVGIFRAGRPPQQP